MRNGNREGGTLLSGVLVLSGASLTVKIIGLLFKIPLSHLLGDEGMGYFNSAYTIYSWLYVIATAGLPIAVSILIARAEERKDREEIATILRSAMITLSLIGALGSVAMLSLSMPLSHMIGSPGSRAAIVAIAPTLLLGSISGGIRGYFQGKRNMIPTATSQLLEALGKLILGILFGLYASRREMPTTAVAAYAIFGVTLGAVAGTTYLIIRILCERRTAGFGGVRIYREREVRTFRSLIRLAFPITLSASVTSMTSLIDLACIMNLLPKAGYSEQQATALFGNYSTLVVPISHAPAILIAPISSSLIPYLSAELEKGNKERAARLSETTLRFVSLLTLPAMLYLGIFGKRILSLVFSESSATVAAPVLAVLSPSVFFFGLMSVTNAILESGGHCYITLRSMIVGAVIKTFCAVALIGHPGYGIAGAAIGSVACYAISSLLNMLALHRSLGRMPSFTDFFVRPFCAASGSALVAVILFKFLRIGLAGSALTLTSFFLSGIVYLVLLPLFRGISLEDLAHLPLISKRMGSSRKKD